MKLYFGGLGHGQDVLAEKETGIKPEICTPETAFSVPAIDRFEELTKQLVREGKDVQAFARELLEKNPEAIVISNEIGYGIHPLEREDRIWREQTGRALCILAEGAETVTRVICGIGQRIKE